MPTSPGNKANDSADTKARLIEACRACLQEEGIAGTSARAIARHGDLNQALVFYHFGSVDGLLQATAREDSARRAALYAERLEGVDTLAALIAVGRAIHDVENHGVEKILTLRVGDPTLRATVPARTDVAIEQAVRFAWNPDKVVLFDKGSGVSLRHAG